MQKHKADNMKSIYLILAIIAASALQAQENPTVVYFIRHAEKAMDAKDPGLTQTGAARAQKWAEWFKDKGIVAVYSTPYKRTMETAGPIAKQERVDIMAYDPLKPALENIIKHHKGLSIVIVGHSNTIPKYVNHLTGENKYTDMEETEYSSVYTVTIYSDRVTHTVEKI